MRRTAYILVPTLILAIMVWAACSLRPLQKGEALTCPSCGAEFTLEEALNHQQEK